MKKRIAIIIIQILFFFSLFLPGLLYWGESLFPDILKKRQLGGYTDESVIPEFSVESYLTGEYQQKYTEWWKNTYGGRTYVIPAYNQIRYSLYNLSVTNTTVCDDGNILRVDEINNAIKIGGYDFSQPSKLEEMYDYAEDINHINHALEQKGVKTLYFLTPSKSSWIKDEIPLRYRIQEKKDSKKASEILVPLLKDNGTELVDCREELSDFDLPVFYKTGVHWSRVAEQYMTVKMLERIRILTGKDIKELHIGELHSQDRPVYRDDDIYSLINIYSGKKDDQYYYYDMVADDKEGESFSILLSGGSFNDGMVGDFISNGILNGGKIYFVSYNSYLVIYEENTEPQIIALNGDFSKIDLDTILSEIDIFIIEGNDGTGVPLLSSGFVNYLDDYLK